MSHTHGDAEMSVATALDSAARAVDRSPLASAAAKLLVMGIAALATIIVTFGVSTLDSRIRASTDPISYNVSELRGQAAAINAKVDAMIAKDKADDADSEKTRQRVALLEQLSVQMSEQMKSGRAERQAQIQSLFERFDKQDEKLTEIFRLLANLQAKQEMMQRGKQ